MENEKLSSEQESLVNKTFDQFRGRDTITDEEMDTVLTHEEEIKEKSLKGALKKFTEEIHALIDMVKAYAKGEYKEIPLTTIVAAVLTLIYVFSPIDIIPDFIPGFGLADDAAMVALCLAAISADVEKFIEWRKK